MKHEKHMMPGMPMKKMQKSMGMSMPAAMMSPPKARAKKAKAKKRF